MIYVINYGILLEVLQEFCTQTRGYDPYDVVANVSGAFLAWILVYLYRRLRNKTQ